MSKVLIIGSEPSDFLLPLLKKLTVKHKLKIGLFELRKGNPNEKEIVKLGLEQLSTPKKPSTIGMLKLLLSKDFFNEFFRSFNLRESFRYANFIQVNGKRFLSYTTYNFHMINKASLYYLKYIPKNKRVVFSFWGTDLLNPPVKSRSLIFNALNRADGISINSVELREVILAKYGRHLFPKIKVALLFDDWEHFKPILELRERKFEIVQKFKMNHNIEPEKKIVAIGHSGHHVDNHMAVLKELAKLDNSTKEKICLVLPMTYGCKDNSYFLEIEDYSLKENLDLRVLKEFLSNEEICALRIASEIHIRLPKYDAFSLSLCETICANNIIITGSWLPYSKLKINGVFHREIEDHSDLISLVEYCINNYEEEVERYDSNHQAIIEMFRKENADDKFFNLLTPNP